MDETGGEVNSSFDVWFDESYTISMDEAGGEVNSETWCDDDNLTNERENQDDVHDYLLEHPSNNQGAEDLQGNRVVLNGESGAGGGQLLSLESESSHGAGFEIEVIWARLYPIGEIVEDSRPFVSRQHGCHNLDQDLDQ